MNVGRMRIIWLPFVFFFPHVIKLGGRGEPASCVVSKACELVLLFCPKGNCVFYPCLLDRACLILGLQSLAVLLLSSVQTCFLWIPRTFF